MARWVSFILVCTIFVPLYTLGAPMPPRVVYPHERLVKRYHMKEESPLNCSRAVSRWVQEAWTTVLNDALKSKKSLNRTLSYGCPFSGNDLYGNQERLKLTRPMQGGYVCSMCGKVFKSEYYIDRHLDRRHTFTPYALLDSYRGGLISEVLDTRTNATVAAPLHEPQFRRIAGCLEDYCDVFDVCDRPPTRAVMAAPNSLSVTYGGPEDMNQQRSQGPQRYREGLCNATLLREAAAKCQEIANSCFPLTSKSPETKYANVYLKLHLCGALESCERYLIRRSYAGSSLHYTEGAYTGTYFKPLSAMPGWQLGLIIFIIVLFIFIALATTCYILETHDKASPYKDRLETEVPAYALRSAMDKTSPTRRRGFDVAASWPDQSSYGSDGTYKEPTRAFKTPFFH